ncbi:AEC family transporter [Clostridium sp. DL1XJH146]
MNPFQIAFNAVMPIFFMIILGYVAKVLGIIKKDFGDQASRLVFRIFLPTMIFTKVANIDLKSSFSTTQLKLLLFTAVAIWGAYYLTKLIFLLFLKEKSREGVNVLGTCIQGGFRTNYLIIGYPILFNLYGDAVVANIALLTLVAIPSFNILSILALTSNDKKNDSGSYKKIIFNIIKNPLIIGIVLGFISSALGLKFDEDYPVFLVNVLNMASSLATPLGLIAIGAFFHFEGFKKSLTLTMVVVSIKLIIIPMIASFAAYLLGFDIMNIVLIIVLLGGPTAVSSFAMGNELGGDPVLAGNIVIMSSGLCVITLLPIITFWMSVLGS